MKEKSYIVGLLSAFTDNNYLYFDKGLDKLVTWPRLDSSSDWKNAEKTMDHHEFSFDISKGSLYKYLKNYPSLLDQWGYGGIILKLITIVLLFALSIIINKFVSIYKIRNTLLNHSDVSKLDVFDEIDVEQSLKTDEGFDNLINRIDLSLHKNISLIKVLAAICPLLGLLGTITGMIETFQGLSMGGSESSTIMAFGISKALVTTVGGLIAAIPVLICHSIVFEMANNTVQKTEDSLLKMRD